MTSLIHHARSFVGDKPLGAGSDLFNRGLVWTSAILDCGGTPPLWFHASKPSRVTPLERFARMRRANPKRRFAASFLLKF